MMLINPDEVLTGALVNVVAVAGRQISRVAAGLRKTDDDLAVARWFETFRMTGSTPELPGLSPATWDRLAGAALGGDEIQAALQELMAARLPPQPARQPGPGPSEPILSPGVPPGSNLHLAAESRE
jgi:hypothetical protein